MVRVNLVDPAALSDQHLIAEYCEILMLFGFVGKHPDTSSTGTHFLKNPVRYFSDKLKYLAKRHALLRKEMAKRGFRHGFAPVLKDYPRWRMKDFSPDMKQLQEIKKRLVERLQKPPRKNFYRYCGKTATPGFLAKLVEKAGKA